jgi:hypothetical protein
MATINKPHQRENPFELNRYEVIYYIRKGTNMFPQLAAFRTPQAAQKFFEIVLIKHLAALTKSYCNQQQFMLLNHLTNNNNDYRKKCFQSLNNFISYVSVNKEVLSINWLNSVYHQEIKESLIGVQPASNSRYRNQHTALLKQFADIATTTTTGQILTA